MEQHPVPRNITGFQFKLIGSMTVKQFLYLAGGVVSGYLLFRFLPLPGILSVMIGLTFAGGGAALAFLPIQGRPLDTWVSAYFKSVFAPTQFVWQKDNNPPPIMAKPAKIKAKSSKQEEAEASSKVSQKQLADVEQKLNQYLAQVGDQPHQALDKQENKALNRTNNVIKNTKTRPAPASPPAYQRRSSQASPAQQPTQPKQTAVKPQGPALSSPQKKSAQPVPTKQTQPRKAEDSSPPSQPANPAVSSNNPLVQAFGDNDLPRQTKRQPTSVQESNSAGDSGARSKGTGQVTPKQPANKPGNLPNSTGKQAEKEERPQSETKPKSEQQNRLQEPHREKEAPKHRLQQVTNKNSVTENSSRESVDSKQSTAEHTSVHVLSEEEATRVGFPQMSDQPNIISGVILAPNRQPLSSALVTIKNSENVIVRAIKTNNLGHFRSSTELPNGTYLLEIEDLQGRYVFDIIKVNLRGNIFTPIEIIAKTESSASKTKETGRRDVQQDKQEEIRKKLFTN